MTPPTLLQAVWPWGHLAFGYVLYSLSRRAAGRGPPTDTAALVLAFGTQFPDLVDKPLAWSLNVLPSGRSLAHSLLFGTLVVALVWWSLDRRDHEGAGWAFAVGYASHLLGDSVLSLLAGRFDRLTFLLWPVLPPVDYENEGLKALLDGFTFTPFVVFGLVLAVATFALWVYDGTPGVAELGRLYRRIRGFEG